MALGISLNPGAQIADGSLVTYGVLRQIANPSIALTDLLENNQITDDTIEMAKLSPGARKSLKFGWHDITDSVHGGTGDGTTDDRAALESVIAAAVADAEAATHRTAVVFFPPGHYLLDSFSSGSLTAGGYCAKFGDQSGDPITLIFYGPGARLVNALYQATGTQYRVYATFKIYPNLTHLQFRGLTFESTAGARDHGGSAECRPTALQFFPDGTGGTLEDISVVDCTFIDQTNAIKIEFNNAATYGLGFNYKRLLVQGCRFLADGNDKGAVQIQGQNGGAGACDETIITGNFVDLVRSGTLVGAVNKTNADGLCLIPNGPRTVISNNVIKHASHWEAIMTIGGNASPGGPGVTPLYSTQITGNVIDMTPATGADAASGWGVRNDAPNSCIAGNTIIQAPNGIYCSNPPASSTNAGKRAVIIGNNINIIGRSSAFGIYTGENATDCSIEGNTIWTNTYDAGSAGEYTGGVFAGGNNTRVFNNRFLVLSKNSLGGREWCGVVINNSPVVTGTIVKGNSFINCNNALMTGIGGTSNPVTFDDNIIESCDRILFDIGRSTADTKILWAGADNYNPIARITFTPTQTGWWTVANGQRQLAGRLRIHVPSAYGNATSEAMTAEITAEMQVSGAGSILKNSLRLGNYSVQNGGAITSVRLATGPTFGTQIVLQVNVATITDAEPITLEWEGHLDQCGLVVPAASPTGETARVVLNLTDPGATYGILSMVSFDTNGGVADYISTSDPTSTAPTGAAEGATVRRTASAASANSKFYQLTNGTWALVGPQIP